MARKKKDTEPAPPADERQKPVLREFNPYEGCPKCWHDVTGRSICPAPLNVRDDGHRYRNLPPGSALCLGFELLEHHHVQCRGCEHVWLQRVAPTPEPPARHSAPVDEDS